MYLLLLLLFLFLKFILDIGSNIFHTTIRKINNWVHLTTITMLHYDLIIITRIRKIIDPYIGHYRINNLAMAIFFSTLILLLTGTNTLFIIIFIFF